jgi:peroxiredoxin Q/BCP
MFLHYAPRHTGASCQLQRKAALVYSYNGARKTDAVDKEFRSMIKVGKDAPDFSLLGTCGDRFTLSDNFGKKRTMLIFYPRDMTPGCRRQLHETSEAREYYAALDTDTFGVNQADAASHLRFIKDQDLKIDLLIDEDFQVSRLYGCMREGAVKMNTRTVIIVGKNGKVIYRAPGSPPLEELLDVLSRATDGPDTAS